MPLEIYRHIEGIKEVVYLQFHPEDKPIHILFLPASGNLESVDIMELGFDSGKSSFYTQVIHPLAVMDTG